MRKDINVKISTETSRVTKSDSVLGICGENLQGNLIFELDEFIVGQAYVEIEQNFKKNLIPLALEDNKYILPIKSSLLACDMLNMNLLIQETSDLEQAPVFKSEIITFRVANSINALENLKDDYPNILDVINNKQNKLKAGTNIEITEDGVINNTYTLPEDVIQDNNYVHTDNNYTDDDKRKLDNLSECNITKLIGTANNPIDLNTIVNNGVYYITGEKTNCPDITDNEFVLKVISKTVYGSTIFKFQFISTINNLDDYVVYARYTTDNTNWTDWSVILDSSKQIDPNNYLSKTNTAAWGPTQQYHPATKDYVDRVFKSIVIPETKDIVVIDTLNDWDTLDNFKTNMLPIIQKIVTDDVSSYPLLFLYDGSQYVGNLSPVIIDKSYAGASVGFTIKLSVIINQSSDKLQIDTYTITYKGTEIQNTEVPTAETMTVDLKDYVKNTDYATSSIGGVVKVSQSYGFNISKGNLLIQRATNAQIADKTNNYGPIVSSNLDYAIKIGITTNTMKLTDEEEANACNWLGVYTKKEIDELAGDIESLLSEV